jgi:hypothetical protein
MDWNLAIERNREALKRILAMLVAMAELANSFTSPLWGGRREASGGGLDLTNTPTRQSGDCRPPHKGEVEPAPTLPRHLHRAILRLLRPAESAVRRLIIVMARGLVVALPPSRPRGAKPASIFLKKPGGTGIYLPPGVSAFPSPLRGGSGGPAARTLSLPLLDPLRSPLSLSPRRPVQTSIPRISFPCYVAPSPITPRLPPAPDDLLDATRLTLRLRALGAALDDLPGQANRFARWRARKENGRDAAGAQNRNPDAAGAQNKRLARRTWPLRPGRPPGQLKAKRRRQDVHEVLANLHWFAFEALEHPDTS